MMKYLFFPPVSCLCLLPMPLAHRRAFSTVDAVFLMKKWISHMAVLSCRSFVLQGNLNLSGNWWSKSDQMDEGRRFHLHDHVLRLFVNVLAIRSVLLVNVSAKQHVQYSTAFLRQWFTGRIASSFYLSRQEQRLRRSESLLLRWGWKLELDDLMVGVFRLPSWEGSDDERRCF